MSLTSIGLCLLSLDSRIPLVPLTFLTVVPCRERKYISLHFWPYGSISDRFPLPCGVSKIQ